MPTRRKIISASARRSCIGGLLRQPVRIALVVFTHVTAIKGQHGVHLVKFLHGRASCSQDSKLRARLGAGLRKSSTNPDRDRSCAFAPLSRAPCAASSGALVAFTLHHIRTGGRPDRRTAAGRLHHGHLALGVALQHLGCRMAKAVAVARLHQRGARLHRVQKRGLDEVLLPWCGTSSTSALTGAERASRACSCAASMSPPAVPRPARAGRLPRWPRATRSLPCWGGPGGRARRPWGAAPQKPRHPHPALPCHARRGRAQGLQRMLGFDRPCQRRPGCWASTAARTGVVGIAVAEHEDIHPFAQRPQQGHQHAVARIAFAAKARACVVQQGVRGRAHQHGIALANVGRQQLKLARRGPRRLPAQQGTNSGTDHKRNCHGRRMASKPPPNKASTPAHNGAAGKTPPPRANWPATAGPPPGAAKPTPPATTTAPTPPRPAPGRDHQRDPRYGQQVGRKPHQRHLAKQQQAQRRERQRHHHCSRNNA